MDSKYLFYNTLFISIIIQIITGIIEIGAFFLVKVPTMYLIIKQLLILELVVQFFEGLFYIWLSYNFTKEALNITPKRYLDWAITTPTMLITLMLYLIYLNKMEENKTCKLEFFTLLKENSIIFMSVVFLNWIMLLFGYLGEIGIINLLAGVAIGFIPFLIYYYIIYINYVSLTNSGYLLFWYFFFFWSLYGVVSVFPHYLKNSFYNILDLFSKNFFGIFLSYILFSGNY